MRRNNYAEYFENFKRVDDTKGIKLKVGAPDDLEDLIYSIHQDYFNGVMPNDWICLTIWEAFNELEDDKLEDITIEADTYYSDLYVWFKDRFAIELCNEVLEEYGVMSDIFDIIGQAQCNAKIKIYEAVNEFIEADSRDDEEAKDE